MNTYWITTDHGPSERYASELPNAALTGRTDDLDARQILTALHEICCGLERDARGLHVVDVRDVPRPQWEPETMAEVWRMDRGLPATSLPSDAWDFLSDEEWVMAADACRRLKCA